MTKNFLTDQSDYPYYPSPDPSSDPFGSDYLTYPTDDGLSELSADSQMADLNSNSHNVRLNRSTKPFVCG